ncbi:flagellar associated protein [Thecamonas trahens ATCC 50062]|uniref:Cilia- and flagella-associated protein 52 n=1 Tax=Thecamonas trahens ATCC 50062 TaxID=461836 RepID=A0A0L0DLZ0_THETB|nr:flagellar associated protein [Thecamonas trahens ATCC 50062]KNC53275.1 flagellar associated protein [Thecamonas trahens ATCC 50062]|eukprot:XP_013754539.1 flagellar associated protein [Thecamonas trahens ATCC 50062]
MADVTTALALDRSFGFAGAVPAGLVLHPNQEHIVYPLGSSVVVRTMGQASGEQFLAGHTSPITTLVVSPSGRYLASGQERFMGLKADVLVWDFESLQLVHRFVLHKAGIKALAFSPNDKYLASLGDEDDNSVVVWDLEAGAAICGAPASMGSSGVAHTLAWLHGSETSFVSGGEYTLRKWELDLSIRKLRAEEGRLGQLKRIIDTLVVAPGDAGVYCGTSTGDVLYVSLDTMLFRVSGPKKPFPKGVTALALTRHAGVIAGSGDGVLASLSPSSLKVTKVARLAGAVTSIALDASHTAMFVGTASANIYTAVTETLATELRTTCHPGKVNDVVYPCDYSEVFATAGPEDVRVWNSRTSEELVRISVPNIECHCVAFAADGSAIFSGWSDGKVRAFGPESGTLLFVINDAHHGPVTAIAPCADGERLISGGKDGEVRVWRLMASSQVMEATMMEHKGPISSIQVASNDMEAITASGDGSCIIWDLGSFIRVQVMFAPSYFMAAAYHPEEAQVLSCGTDRKICFWDAYDGSAIREIELLDNCAANSIAIFADGEAFVSGGNDKLVKLWSYDGGEVIATGSGHSSNIVKVVISPDQSEIVSISEDGAVFVWAVPAELIGPVGVGSLRALDPTAR